ncbi:MAG: deoxyribose-phosphate aldolase [Bacteroidaceae bacterium]
MSEQTHFHLPVEDKYETAFSKYNLHIHDENIHEAIQKQIKTRTAENNTDDVKKLLLSCIELTSLRVTDSNESILKLTENVNALTDLHPELPPFASICVYPRYASLVSQSLEVESTAIACVAGGFPSSQTPIEVKTVETALALNDGATEIDFVMPVGAFLSGDYETVNDEISELKEICGDKKLKVILETGALQTAVNIKRAAIMAMYSGADFIKTSTGKIEPAATPDAAYVMCQTIKEYFDETGIRIGFKAAGGIKTIEDAILYYTIVKELLGKEWLNNHYFRIGTSKLANLLLTDLLGKEFSAF